MLRIVGRKFPLSRGLAVDFSRAPSLQLTSRQSLVKFGRNQKIFSTVAGRNVLANESKLFIQRISVVTVTVSGLLLGSFYYLDFGNFVSELQVDQMIPKEHVQMLLRGEKPGSFLKVYDVNSVEYKMFRSVADEIERSAVIFIQGNIDDALEKMNQSKDKESKLAWKLVAMRWEARLACISQVNKVKVVVYNGRTPNVLMSKNSTIYASGGYFGHSLTHEEKKLLLVRIIASAIEHFSQPALNELKFPMNNKKSDDIFQKLRKYDDILVKDIPKSLFILCDPKTVSNLQKKLSEMESAEYSDKELAAVGLIQCSKPLKELHMYDDVAFSSGLRLRDGTGLFWPAFRWFGDKVCWFWLAWDHLATANRPNHSKSKT